MILSDYLRDEKDLTWDYARQCGVTHAVIRIPDTGFDVTSADHWKTLTEKYKSYGFTPVAVEPLPDHLHAHIKTGDKLRDACIEKVIKMFPQMRANGIRILCFNFMAYIGWMRTSSTILERGGAEVTGFRMEDFTPDPALSISKAKLWENYRIFLQAVLPYAEKYGIFLALHPDDPPVPKLGNVCRIFTSFDSIYKGVHLIESDYLGVTMCQACYVEMGESLPEVITRFAKENKIFYIHFRDVVGQKFDFHESFHDNGQTDMANILRLYHRLGINVPIRVDHVPKMAGENNISVAGYGTLGRLFAIGYLKGLLDMLE